MQAGLKSQGTPGQKNKMVKSKKYRKVKVFFWQLEKKKCNRLIRAKHNANHRISGAAKISLNFLG